MITKFIRLILIFVVVLLSLSGSETVVAAPTFDDVPYDYWAYEWIERLYDSGVTSGCNSSPLKYCPEQYVTRAEMAIFLERGKHYPDNNYVPTKATGDIFNDVPISAFAADWIEQLAADGITIGCGGGNYCPRDQVTRAQMAIFLLRAKHGADYIPPEIEEDENVGFDDVNSDDFAAAWIKQLAKEGITSGCGGGNYCPNAFVTRAEVAKFLVTTFDLPEIPSVPMATVTVENNTGGELCYEVYDTGIGQQCFGAGKHFYGVFPSGAYDFRGEARCGNLTGSYEYDGEIVHEFWCNVLH